MSVQTDAFYRALDERYASGRVHEAAAFLSAQEKEAEKSGDLPLLLAVENAWIGHCREHGLTDEIERHIQSAEACLERLALGGSLHEATTLLNIATAFCRMDRLSEAEALYDRVSALYSALLPPRDPRMAALQNNRGLLLRAQGRNEAAFSLFTDALERIRQFPDSEAEAAATLLNLVSVCDDPAQASELLAEAMRYYESAEGRRDIHRFTAMAASAELCFRTGAYLDAARRFEAAAKEMADAGLSRERVDVLLQNAAVCYDRAGRHPGRPAGGTHRENGA